MHRSSSVHAGADQARSPRAGGGRGAARPRGGQVGEKPRAWPPENPDAFRTAFERDRDRIIHSKAFRRLKHKTQVFLNPEGDHFVTRLTHTLQVTQIARALAAALSLNEPLAEAIALGHDVGHSPFGHTGEEALSPYFPPGGWHHAAQSVRIFEVLEDLNLTWEVRDGIRAHSWKIDAAAGDAGGAVRALRRSDRLPHPRRPRCAARRRARGRSFPPTCVSASASPGAQLDRRDDRRRHRELACWWASVTMDTLDARGHERAARLHVRAGLRIGRSAA